MLIHDPSWQNFMKHYWLSFIWIAVAISIIVMFIGMPEQTLNSPIILFPVGAGIFRAFRGGWRPDKDVQQNDGCFIVILQLVFVVVLWPLVEIFRQIRFLWKARRIWRDGEILVNDKDRPMRSA